MTNDLTIDQVGMVKKAYTAVITQKEQKQEKPEEVSYAVCNSFHF
jgi:hypothetical protein